MSENESSGASMEQIEFEIPGIDKFRARKGTSTAELAGAAKYWHDKWKAECGNPRESGFIGGFSVALVFTLLGHAIYFIWSHT